MFETLMKKSFWQSLFPGTAGSGRTKFTFEELRALSDVLNKNQIVTEANKAVVVETIRSIAEFMIWGDQNEPRIFDFFMENNIMHYLHRVLQQPANRTGDVAKQVLQTLSIIIQNIRSETGTYFLFSNNHINNIVEIRFDFEDEEVLGYYISFLKTISLKLNAGTVQFFFDRRDDSAYTFPLYSEAVKFAHHKEGMVRAGVRTLTLNVYSVPDPYIQDYVCRPPATSYLAEMASYIADQIKILDKRMVSAEGFSQQVLNSLDSQLAEVEDMISYVADILSTAHPKFAHLAAEQLWVSLVGPYLLRPLLEYGTSKAAGQLAPGPRRTSAGGGAPSSPGAQTTPLVRVSCSLYVLERLFVAISYPALVNNLALALLDPRVGHPSCRSALVGVLRSEDHRAVPAALRCLVALVHNKRVSPEVLALLSLVPRSRAADLHAACAAGDCAACRLREQLTPLPEGCAAAGVGPDALAEEPLPVATVAAAVGQRGGAGVSAPVFGYHVLWTRVEGPAQGIPERPDYGDSYPGDNDVDVSISSFSEGTVGQARAQQLQGTSTGGDEQQDEGEEADLLGGPLGDSDGSAGDASAVRQPSSSSEAHPLAGSSSQGRAEAAARTSRDGEGLLLSGAAGAADRAGAAGSTSGGQSLAASADEGSTGAPPSGGPVLSAPAAEPPHTGSGTAREADLLGLKVDPSPPAAVGSGGSAVSAGAPEALLLDSPPVADVLGSVPDTTGPAAVPAADVASDLIELGVREAPAATSGASPPAANPIPSDLLGPGLVTGGSSPSLGAAASGSLLDSLLEPVSSGPPPQLSPQGEAQPHAFEPQGKQPKDDTEELEPAPGPAEKQKEALGQAAGASPLGGELLSFDEDESPPSAVSASAGSGSGPGPAGAGPLDLLDAPLQPAGSQDAASAAPGGTSSDATAAASAAEDPLGALLGPNMPSAAAAVEHPSSPSVITGAAASCPAHAAEAQCAEDLDGGLGAAALALPEASSSASDHGTGRSAGAPHADTDADADTPAAEEQAPAPNPVSPPAPPPPPPAPPLPPPAAPPPVPEPTGPPCPAHARPVAAAASPDVLDALFALLSMQLLPVPGLWNVVLLLGQLYPRAEELRELRQLSSSQPQTPPKPHGSADPLQASGGSAAADQLADLLGVGADGGDDALAAGGSPLATGPRPGSSAASGSVLADLDPQQQQQPHPLDPASTVGWACELSAAQREALRCAAVSAASSVLDEVGGLWCDALFAMLVLEWPAAHHAVTVPALRTGAEALMAGPHLYPRQNTRGVSGASRNDQGLSGSAVAALHSYHAVARLVALLLLHDLLRKGSVEKRPPPSCAQPPGGDLEQRELDLLEGQEVELQTGSAIPCIVSFSPGQERRVYFSTAGPALRRLSDYLHNPQALLADPTSQSVVMHSSPAVILADPAPTRLNAGIVISVAPLLGCEPSVDKNVPKWLHVYVRPSVRGLLRLLRSAASAGGGKKGGLLGALRHLLDGHWVLAFPDAERASNAKQLVEQSAHRLRALYCELLSPVLSTVMD